MPGGAALRSRIGNENEPSSASDSWPFGAETPLIAVTRPTVAIFQVEQILQGARRQGRDVDAILRRAGISPALLGSPLSRISQARYASLMRTLHRVTCDEFWGLGSRRVPLGTFALCCRHLVHCRTLGEALRDGFDFWNLAIDDFSARLQVVDGVARIRLVARGPAADDADACLDYAQRVFLYMGFGLSSWLVARRIPLQRVCYRTRSAERGSEADGLFDAPVVYGSPRYGVEFESRWLELPIVQTRQSLEEFLERVPGQLIGRYRDQATLTERIRRQLRRRLDQELPSFDEVARALAMTPQTLRRRLQDEGQGYQALKDDLRRDAAIEYLARADLTLCEIAGLLGFSEPSAFHRAFKRWTGVAPGEYRNSHLAEDAPDPVAGDSPARHPARHPARAVADQPAVVGA